MKEDTRPVCTKEEPKREMGLSARHPDARMIYRSSGDYEDEKWECPDCGYQWWKEGADY